MTDNNQVVGSPIRKDGGGPPRKGRGKGNLEDPDSNFNGPKRQDSRDSDVEPPASLSCPLPVCGAWFCPNENPDETCWRRFSSELSVPCQPCLMACLPWCEQNKFCMVVGSFAVGVPVLIRKIIFFIAMITSLGAMICFFMGFLGFASSDSGIKSFHFTKWVGTQEYGPLKENALQDKFLFNQVHQHLYFQRLADIPAVTKKVEGLRPEYDEKCWTKSIEECNGNSCIKSAKAGRSGKEFCYSKTGWPAQYTGTFKVEYYRSAFYQLLILKLDKNNPGQNLIRETIRTWLEYEREKKEGEKLVIPGGTEEQRKKIMEDYFKNYNLDIKSIHNEVIRFTKMNPDEQGKWDNPKEISFNYGWNNRLTGGFGDGSCDETPLIFWVLCFLGFIGQITSALADCQRWTEYGDINCQKFCGFISAILACMSAFGAYTMMTGYVGNNDNLLGLGSQLSLIGSPIYGSKPYAHADDKGKTIGPYVILLLIAGILKIPDMIIHCIIATPKGRHSHPHKENPVIDLIDYLLRYRDADDPDLPYSATH